MLANTTFRKFHSVFLPVQASIQSPHMRCTGLTFRRYKLIQDRYPRHRSYLQSHLQLTFAWQWH